MRAALLGAGSFALALAVAPRLVRADAPPLSALPSTPFALQDAALVSAGLRACAADLAWMQLLQYMAGGTPELVDPPDKPFAFVGPMCLRVARLDPAFSRAYLFGAGVLAWFHNTGRTDEAIALLQEGLRADPTEPRFSIYIAALAFQKRGESDKMLAVLEPILGDPRSPIEMKAIVANLYKTRGDYAKALAIWDAMLDNELDRREWPRAREQSAQIRALMKKKPQ